MGVDNGATGKYADTMLSESICRDIERFFGKRLLSVAIFGSVARGTAEFPQSDIDILIVVRDVENLSFVERVRQTMKAEEELSKTEEFIKFKDTFGGSPNIQEIILGNEELKDHLPILLDLTTYAITLYDTGILNEEIEKIKKRLKELGARKVAIRDSWFWILKSDVKLGENVQT